MLIREFQRQVDADLADAWQRVLDDPLLLGGFHGLGGDHVRVLDVIIIGLHGEALLLNFGEMQSLEVLHR